MTIRVLIADDSATSRILLKSALSRWGYEVVVAENGAQAWDILAAPEAPTIAILDWVMPFMTGPEVCRRLREARREPYTYVLLLTSKNTKGETVEGLEAGADDYIVKPFDEHELQVRIRTGVRILGAISHTTPTLQAIEFYSCFISHASANIDLAEKLDADLRSAGVTCWYAPKDLRVGDEFRLQIDQSIRMHDKLLLILSEASIRSEWVTAEVESALDQESVRKRVDPRLQGNTTVLFPIRIDDTTFQVLDGWPALIRRTRHIGDFRGWRDEHRYRAAFNRLLRDLRAGDVRDRIAEENRRQAAETHWL